MNSLPPRILRPFAIAAALLPSACTPGGDAPLSPSPAPSQTAPAPAASAPVSPARAVPLVVSDLYVDAIAEPDEGSPPLVVVFTAIVEDHSGSYGCRWDFGDGSPPSNETNPTHTYEREGDFIITLSCRDEKGLEGDAEIDVTVYEFD